MARSVNKVTLLGNVGKDPEIRSTPGGTMVANLSSHKAGWDDRWEEFSNWAEKGQ